ncbi:MAG: TetR/AcrR family transcriptional regulator C-terminal domain-containing protein [Clostridia bacterium]|nr:TetR/AcrR family transcriptional regulator C-terminal domain-containing protein [Clostridia bacterium]MBR5427334.1 TetR/AcrR family transcriptional regulator C-terminal domain-containing protein [Clostridia bacterium]
MERKRAEYKSSIASKNQLKHAFAELLYQNPINKVTVTAVIAKAGVSRSTFYAHYNDIDDLLSAIIREESARIIEITESTGIGNIYLDPKPVLTAIADHLSADADYYKKLYLSDKSGEFITSMKKAMTEKLLSEETTANLKSNNINELKVYCAFYVSAFLSVIVDRFIGEIDLPRQDMIEIVSSILERSFAPTEK